MPVLCVLPPFAFQPQNQTDSREKLRRANETPSVRKEFELERCHFLFLQSTWIKTGALQSHLQTGSGFWTDATNATAFELFQCVFWKARCLLHVHNVDQVNRKWLPLQEMAFHDSVLTGTSSFMSLRGIGV